MGLSGGKSAFRPIFRCLLAAPGPLPGRSWGSPGPLLTPPGSLLGSLGALRGWFCELFALLLQAPSKNRENLVFLQTVQHFLMFFHGSGVPESSQNRPKSLREASWAPSWPQKCAQSDLGSPWETGKAIQRDIWGLFGRKREGEEPGWGLPWPTAGALGRGRGGVATPQKVTF